MLDLFPQLTNFATQSIQMFPQFIRHSTNILLVGLLTMQITLEFFCMMPHLFGDLM